LWQDPSGQNDSDTDAIAWEDFKLTQDATLTRVRWIGEPAPSLGFQISFWPQDPNTISLQPDLFGGPFDEHTYPSVSQTSIGNGLYSIEVQLAVPQHLLANTQYFIAIIGMTHGAFQQWRWAQGYGPNTGTFYWQRGNGSLYSRLPEDRAMTLMGPDTLPTLVVSPDPLIAGQNGTFTMIKMTPSTRSYLVYSVRGLGSTFVGQLNVTLDLAQPQQAGAPKTTDASGCAVWTLPIPANAAGRNIWFQAAQFENKTNVLTTSVIR